MKKLFTMTMLALIGYSVGADAQNYRKWDFTQWSAQTVANLTEEATKGQLGGSWSDIEKKDAGATTPGGGVCFWSYGDNVSEDGYLVANETVIAETEGLVFNTGYTTRRSLALAVDYPSTSLGDYAGPQYLWLGGGNAKSASARIACFTIPNVRIGQKMTFTVESHKPSDARGVALFVGDCTNDAFQIGESFTPKTRETYTWEGWELPEGATDNGDGTVDVIVYNTNGCHIYSIEIGDNNEKSKAAFLYEGDLDSNLAYTYLNAGENFDLVPLNVTGAFSLDQLTEYDAIVISSSVTNAEAIASLKAIQPFVPTLCLNTDVYAAWGYGSVADTETPFAAVLQPNHALFRDLGLLVDDQNEDIMVLPLTQDSPIKTVTLEGLFKDDVILATAYGTENVAIHGHSLSRNAYLYIPYTQEALADAATPEILINAVTFLANTKAKVAQAPAPIISQEYKDRLTIVTLKSTVAGAEIFYTIDGSEPTEQSTLYTEPFEITSEGVTVKAVVRGDGYLLSEVAELAISIKSQAAAPTINVDGNTVTITTDVADGVIYYNYNGSNEIAKSAQYTEPIVLTRSRTIYAFVAAEGFINSELASQEITIEGSKNRTNILSHMDSNSEEYNSGSTSTTYYFSWGKQKGDYPYYNLDTRTEEAGTDPDTGDEITIVSYSELNDEEEKDFETGWILRSRGQIVDWENLSTGTNYGDHGGYNYATPEDDTPDFPATKGVIVLADKNTEPSDVTVPFSFNAYLVSSAKFAGPFDIVANIGSIIKPENNANHNVVLQVATDGNAWDSNWQTVGDTINISDRQRLTTNVVRSYNGTEEVYVRAYLCGGNSKVGFYDIYIANNPNEEVGPSIPGDVNGDGTVDVADISAIISVMAGTATYENADVNGDNTVDVADISNVISIMAGQ